MLGSRNKYSDEELLGQLKKHYLKNNSITSKSFDEDGEVCSLNTIQNRFGSWNNAMEISGIKNKLVVTFLEKIETKELLKYCAEENWEELAVEFDLEEYSKEEIHRQYRKLKNENKKFAKSVFAEKMKESYKKNKEIAYKDFNARAVTRYFETWQNALKETGIKEQMLEEKRKNLFERMKKFIEKTGRKPHEHEYRLKYGLPSIVVINRYYGNKSELLKEFGYERGIVGNGITKDQISEMIQSFYEREGRKPEARDFKKKNNMPSMEQIYFHYSGINEATGVLGFKDSPRRKKYTQKEALKGLRDFYMREGREPLKADIKNENGLPSLKKLRSLFGTLGEAKEKANIPMKMRKKAFYTKYGIEELLVEKYLEKGGKLTIKEIDYDRDLPSAGTILNLLRIQLVDDLWKYLEKKYKLKKHLNERSKLV